MTPWLEICYLAWQTGPGEYAEKGVCLEVSVAVGSGKLSSSLDRTYSFTQYDYLSAHVCPAGRTASQAWGSKNSTYSSVTIGKSRAFDYYLNHHPTRRAKPVEITPESP